jgi:glycosyltransferase involved in cell wall biosynthesis
MSPKHLYFFTNHYPYGGESFVGNEIEALSKFYDKILLFPTVKGKEIKDKLPSNVEVVQLGTGVSGGKFGLLFSNLPMIISIFCLDFFKNTDKKGFLKKFRYNLSLLLNTIGISSELAKKVESDNSDKRFVSFWMDQWSLALSILKFKKKIKDFVFRVHQHDLYADNNPTQYIPFRFFNIKMTKAVFPDSKRGVNFLKDLNYFPEKMHVGHLGVIDKGTNVFSDKKFVMVSCSALIARKRVDLIADVLKALTIPLTWIHFGAKGEGADAFEKLQTKCKSLPQNIEVILKGDVSYTELIKFYQETPVNLFITLTRAEGLPVSVIEAISFGIPVLATDVMGLPDVVTDESGIVIQPDLETKKIAEVITQFASGTKNTPEFRARTKNFWRANFSSDINYSKFNAFINN